MPHDPLIGNGPKLGVQVIPYTAVFEEPRLKYPEMIQKRLALSSFRIQQSPTSDDKGVFVQDGPEISRLDKDATAQLWRHYAPLRGAGLRPEHDRLLPYLAFAEDILRYVQGTRIVLARHGIFEPRVITRVRPENVLDKLLVYDRSGSVLSRPFKSPFLETAYVISDVGEEEKILEDLWYGAGAQGLGQDVLEMTARIATLAKQWKP
jgi:hypothetical protein